MSRGHTVVYRLARRAYAKNPFDGEGSFRFGGRWSKPGTRLVYTAEHLSLAMLEYLAHLDPNDVPDDIVVAEAHIPREVSRTRLSPDELPEGWARYPAPSQVANVGDRFVRPGKAAILIVPSALVPVEDNWLINPEHPDSRMIRRVPITDFKFDHRLL